LRLSHFLIIYFAASAAQPFDFGLKKRHQLHNKNILDEMNINKAREIQIVYT
jgi:hypothetical protein